jgi:hypothetical protein
VSRSRKKTPITGIAGCRSEKWWKRVWHKKFRRRSRAAIRSGAEPPHFPEEVGADEWLAPRDGTFWFGRWAAKRARNEDAETFEKRRARHRHFMQK